MTLSDSIKQDLMDFADLAKEAAELLKGDTENAALKAVLIQNENQVQDLRQQLVEALLAENRHRIQLILKNYQKYQSIPIDIIAGLFGIISAIVKELSRGLLSKADGSVSLVYETDFPSSFGVLLSTQEPDYELIGANNSVFDRFFGIIQDLEEFRSDGTSFFSKIANRQLLNRLKSLVSLGADNGLDLSITWGDLQQEPYRASRIGPDQFRLLRGFFKEFEKQEQLVELTGKIVGLSLVRNKLEFQLDNSELIVASIDGDNLDMAKVNIGQRFRVSFKEIKKFKENSDIFYSYYSVVVMNKT